MGMNEQPESLPEWKLWKLPDGAAGIQSFERDPPIGSWDRNWAIIYETYRRLQLAIETKNEKNEKRLNTKLLDLLTVNDGHILSTYLLALAKQLQQGNGDKEMGPKQWMARKAQTLVSHMIYSFDREDHSHQLRRFPLMYVLQDPNTGRGMNLVHLYRQAKLDGQTEIEHAVRVIWNEIKHIISLDVGEFAAENFRDHLTNDISEDGKYAKEQMIMLKNVMLTADEGIMHPALEVQYDTQKKEILAMNFDGGIMEMHVYDGYPEFTETLPLFTKDNTGIANSIYTEHPESRTGLFISIRWQFTDSGEAADHCLYLSEYQHNKLHATLGQGLLKDFQRVTTRMPRLDTTELAIHCMKVQRGKYKIEYPINLDELVADVIQETLKNHPNTQKVLDELLLMNANTKGDVLPILEAKTIYPVYYFGDNTLFLLLYFDTTHPLVKALLNRQDFEDSRFFVQVLVLRYPVLKPLNMERTMINIRYKYFMRHTTRPEKWNLWLKGKWHIRVADPYDPEQFQVPALPKTIDPLAWVEEEDFVSKRKVFSLRYLQTLPPLASWAKLSAHNQKLSTSYYVNNIETNPDIVYELPGLQEAVWDTVQKFRINAEVRVSRFGHERFQESFFLFRTRAFAEPRREGYPFKAYLEKYPALQHEWGRIWKEERPNMMDWRQFNINDPRPNRNARRSQQALPSTADSSCPRGWHPARMAGQRRQNERFLLSLVCDYFTPP
jgi:hypothetical protein